MNERLILTEKITLLTTESIRGRAVDVGFRVLLFVVLIESLALTILTVESNEVVCRLEFECRKVDLLGTPADADGGSLSTLRRRSGMSIVFDFAAALSAGVRGD